jgi:phosphate/sulfate permease
MGMLLWLATYMALPLASAHSIARAALIGALIIAGLALYGLFLMLFGVVRPAEAARAVGHFRGRGLRR